MIKQPGSEGTEDYVLLLYAHDRAEAEFYKSLLLDHDIEAVIDKDAEVLDLLARGRLPVMVPQELVEEAREIIEQRADMDDKFEDFAGGDYQGDDEDAQELTGLGGIAADQAEVEVFDGEEDETDEEELY